MAKASFRTVDEVGSVQRLARPLDKPLQLPSLLTMDEAAQPRDVRVSTLQFVAGMARYSVFPCCFCRRACKGTMTSEAGNMVKKSTLITTVQFCCALAFRCVDVRWSLLGTLVLNLLLLLQQCALAPVILFAFGLVELSPTEAFAPAGAPSSMQLNPDTCVRAI